MIVRDSNGKKVISKAGENQITQGKKVLKSMLPTMLSVKSIAAMLGFKSKSFDGRNLPLEYKGVDVRDIKSTLSKKKIAAKTKRFEKMGINVDAIPDAKFWNPVSIANATAS